ncbi:CRP-like cAMP-binding protein [Bradyrhizobium sp. CIR48]|uniref:Crp/Fnr family transcriptional regulator n=1 Tax=Bradyrhizobium sp. CIR48 TaxID=2663840 RepID=UPI00160567DF|nr:Crp/Fnr family transcriptional regulator [Bradyrhizobium sp. CIR48]MBB4428315.1 CRP-like cAMP-binding protein [Bradyrhizobium sp. CIR48]
MRPDSYTIRNDLLRAMSPEEFDSLRPHLEFTTFDQGHLVQQIDEPMDYIHFVESGIVSLVVRSAIEAPVEISAVLPSGMIGSEIMFGAGKAIYRAVVQVPDTLVVRIKLEDLRRAQRQHPNIDRIFLEFARFLMRAAAQNLFCQAKHSLEQRLAKWLVIASGQFDDGLIPVKQDDLAMALGVHRPSVSWAVARLANLGLVERRRAAIQLSDTSKLCAHACPCVSMIKRFELHRGVGTTHKLGHERFPERTADCEQLSLVL